MSELDLLKQLKKANERIVSLCGTVNCYSEQLGLGRKVRAEDWQIDADSLIKEALPNDRIEIKSMHSSVGKDVKEGDVVHPDVYIKEMVKLHHETWVVGPIDRAIGILNLHAEVIQRSEKLLQGLENLGLEQLLDIVEAGRKSR